MSYILIFYFSVKPVRREREVFALGFFSPEAGAEERAVKWKRFGSVNGGVVGADCGAYARLGLIEVPFLLHQEPLPREGRDSGVPHWRRKGRGDSYSEVGCGDRRLAEAPRHSNSPP